MFCVTCYMTIEVEPREPRKIRKDLGASQLLVLE